MNEENLIKYYNKFNEDKRFNSRHGMIEYITTLSYIKTYLSKYKAKKILDIGAGTGNYSVPLSNMGYSVTAIDLVKHNIRVIEKKTDKVKTLVGNATDLNKLEDNTFDMVLLLGPMYHLITKEEKIKALKEAKRVTKKGGIIMVAYIMNEYAVIIHGFRDNNILNAEKENLIDKNFKITPKREDLYSYMRIEDINELNNAVNLKRLKIISVDSCANYIRDVLNKMDDETFNKFIEYNFTLCERYDVLGAAAHTLDILKK